MYTLFSVTNTLVADDVLSSAYSKILEAIKDIDNSLSQYENTYIRLSKALVQRVDSYGVNLIGVANPSFGSDITEDICGDLSFVSFNSDDLDTYSASSVIEARLEELTEDSDEQDDFSSTVDEIEYILNRNLPEAEVKIGAIKECSALRQ